VAFIGGADAQLTPVCIAAGMQPLSHKTMGAEMFARLAMLTVVALALAVGSQAKATPLTYGTYYDEEFVGGSCPNSQSCRANFSPLPSDNLLLLKKINCEITSSQPIVFVIVTISQTSGGQDFGRGIYVNPGPAVVTSASSSYLYSFQTDAQLLIGQGRYPFIQVETSGGSISMVCGILGDLVTPISG
jgi:hypothetical protein